MNKNYQGSIRFVDDETLVTESFGMTGDIVFVLEPGEETTTEKYVKATSTDEGALKVVANTDDVVTFTKGASTDTGALQVVADDYAGTVVYTAAQSTDTGALQVVADGADPFDAETQIKISDVTGITVEVGDYVTKTTVPFDAETQIKIGDVTGITVNVGDYVIKTVTPFDESTMVVLADVTADVADAAVGDYVVKKEVTTTTPPTVKSASVKLDKNWLPFVTTE